MQVNEENENENQGDILASNTEINPNQVNYNQSSTTETYEPAGQTKYSYTATTRTVGNNFSNSPIEEEGNIPEETTEVKTYKREGKENTTETTIYEKRVTTKTTTIRGGDISRTQINNTRYSNVNTNNNTRSSGIRNQSGTSNTYTRPSPSNRGSVENNSYLRKYDNGRTPSTNRTENAQYKRYGGENTSNSNNYSSQYNNRTNQRNRPSRNTSSNSQSYVGNRYQPKRPETSTYNRLARSPDQNDVKRKTINRGAPVKNIQITHIICSSKPSDFHITENLNTDTLEMDPIEISKADRLKLQKTGKSSWTSSVQDNIKPIVTNLKGKTTVFQHARGIGMTNEKKENINPMFYSSEIKKLDPIIKEKEKEKVEYMTFRNEGAGNSNTYSNNSNRTNYNNYNRGNNNQQKRNYGNSTQNYNNYNSRGSKTNNIRNNSNYNRGSYSGSGYNGEIVKETRTKVQMGSRSQYRNTGNPTTSVSTEKKVYSSNTFFK